MDLSPTPFSQSGAAVGHLLNQFQQSHDVKNDGFGPFDRLLTPSTATVEWEAPHSR